jgi:hypothetical protein
MIVFKTIIEYNDLWSKIFKVPIVFSNTQIVDDCCFEIYRFHLVFKNKTIFVYVPKRLYPFIEADVVVCNPICFGKLSSMTNFENNEHFHSVIMKELLKAFYKELFNERVICSSVW